MKIVFLDAATMGSTPLTEIEKLGELTTYDSSTAEEARERVKDADGHEVPIMHIGNNGIYLSETVITLNKKK